MIQKKHDVRLYYSYCSTSMEPMHCGSLTMEQIEKYLQELATQKKISHDSCTRHLTAHFENKASADVFLSREYQCPDAPQRENTSRLNLYMTTMNNRKCNARDCFNNIRTGKCTDTFVIETIGKKFFADKYQDKQK